MAVLAIVETPLQDADLSHLAVFISGPFAEVTFEGGKHHQLVVHLHELSQNLQNVVQNEWSRIADVTSVLFAAIEQAGLIPGDVIYLERIYSPLIVTATTIIAQDYGYRVVYRIR